MTSTTIQAGQRVRLVKVHPSMNAWVKSKLGSVGEVLGPCEPGAVKVRVSLEGFSACWIRSEYLQVV